MKKITLTAFAAIIAFCAFMPAGADTFEGTIVYTVAVDGLPQEAQGMMANSIMTMYVKGDRSRTEMIMGPMQNTNIVDRKAKTVVTLIDMMGQKSMIRSNQEEMDKKSAANPPVIKYVDESKTIAGYKCKKAEITSADKEGKTHLSTAWYTTELPYHKGSRAELKELKGFPLEFEISERQMNIKLTAKSVTKTAVDDNKFVIPDGYKEMKTEDLMHPSKGTTEGEGH